MLGNFFMLTCPYLYDVQAIAYFSLLRDHHSARATSAISNTAQVLVDVHRHKGRLYIHPLKAQQRHSPTMYMLHACEGEEFLPVVQSATIAEILTTVPWRRLVAFGPGVGIWDRTFERARQLFDGAAGGEMTPEAREVFHRLIRMAVSRDERVFELVRRHLAPRELIEIGNRMIGTGLIGGKSVGMLLARAILRKAGNRWAEMLEPHDSFYIGSDVFYTFLVTNGVWWARQRQRDPTSFLEGAERARQAIIRGAFPEEIEKQFADMLDYFGQSPIIVRSSSLLEDNFGNAFAGKYESVFCANQGSRDRRLEDFKSAVRTIYASTMSEKALQYRADRGLLDCDEQMALLVQRVSGRVYGNLFYPQVAGVGFSFNPYRWNADIDPEAGMIRLVFGLGTRAVDRSDDDYTRVVALNAPSRRPEAGIDEIRQFAQRKVDVIDLEANQLLSNAFEDVLRRSPALSPELFASRDEALERRAAAKRRSVFPWVLTFERLLSETPFVGDMKEMLHVLAGAYGCPVDVEFTVNFLDGDRCKIDLVQCRPFQVAGGGEAVKPPEHIPANDLVLRAGGAVIGRSRVLSLDRIIYVIPAAYGQLPTADRYAVARLVGRATHAEPARQKRLLLLGPGRWGTTTPSLGVPAAFSEISPASALCEIVAMREDLVPDVSLGTHYFSDLVERDILYVVLFPSREGNALNAALLEQAPNRVEELVDGAGRLADVVRVIDVADLPGSPAAVLNANALEQSAVCYLQRD
jgi:hypothetical protein